MLPCGTPNFMSSGTEEVPVTETNSFLPIKYDLIHLSHSSLTFKVKSNGPPALGKSISHRYLLRDSNAHSVKQFTNYARPKTF